MPTIMAQPPSVATAVADGLQAAGIDTVFGLPGGENVHLMEAMRRAGLRFVLSEHENAAAFMAAAASQLTRRPTACLTTLGPGAVNCTAGVAHAFLDRCPVLVLTAQMAPSLQDRHTHQLVDLHRLFAPITKATLDVTPAGAATAVRDALRIATGGMSGPVHLQIPNDVAALAAETIERGESSPAVADAPPSVTAADLARAAARPGFRRAAGGRRGVGGWSRRDPTRSSAGSRSGWARRSSQLRRPRGAFPASHPLGSETIGLTRTDPGYDLIAEADRVIAVGMGRGRGGAALVDRGAGAVDRPRGTTRSAPRRPNRR